MTTRTRIPSPRMAWMTDGSSRQWVSEGREPHGWTVLAEVEIPEPIATQLDVIRADAIDTGYEASDLTTYADLFEYVCDGCYLPPGYKPGAASYDPGDDPVSIAYAIVLGYEQGIGHLIRHVRTHPQR